MRAYFIFLHFFMKNITSLNQKNKPKRVYFFNWLYLFDQVYLFLMRSFIYKVSEKVGCYRKLKQVAWEKIIIIKICWIQMRELILNLAFRESQ